MAVKRVVTVSMSSFFAALLLGYVCIYFDVPTFLVRLDSSGNDNQGITEVPVRLTIHHKKNHSPGGNRFMAGKVKQSITSHDPLSMAVAAKVTTFVFFLGHPRSGHSIVGSLLDAHPHMVIANEADVFSKLLNGQIVSPNKYGILDTIWTSSSDKLRLTNSKGYRLFVDGLFEGTYLDYIDVMGDKRAGVTTELLLRHPTQWKKAFDVLRSHFDPIKVIHVIRNPYDNIATKVLYHILAIPKIAEVKKNNRTLAVHSSIIEQNIADYFACHKAIVIAQQTYQLDLLEMHGRDLIENPMAVMMRMCSFLGVNCSHNYLEICSNKVFKGESKTRHLIKWTDEQIEKIQANIKKYDSLRRYTFNL